PAAGDDAPAFQMNEVGDGEAGHGGFDREQARQSFYALPFSGKRIGKRTGGGTGDRSCGLGLGGGVHNGSPFAALPFALLTFAPLRFGLITFGTITFGPEIQ